MKRVVQCTSHVPITQDWRESSSVLQTSAPEPSRLSMWRGADIDVHGAQWKMATRLVLATGQSGDLHIERKLHFNS